jgi:hypothetical protein
MRTARRALLLAPPAFLFGGSLVMLLAAPFAWGLGNEVGLPAWMPAASGIAFALPAAVIGGLCLRAVIARTREDFSAGVLQLAFALFLLVLAACAEVALALRISDPDTYEALRDEDGDVNTSPAGFFFITLFVTAFLGFWVGVGAYLYTQAITIEAGNRFRRDRDEPDAIDAMMRYRPRR